MSLHFPSTFLLSSQTLLHDSHIKTLLHQSLHFTSLISATMSAWSCSSCTFLNPPSQKTTCQICHTPSFSSSPSSPSPSLSSYDKWSCKACTFLNPYNRSNCEICDTRASFSYLSTLQDLDPDEDDLGGSIFYPLRRCNTNTVEISDMGFGKKPQNDDLFVGSGSRSYSSKRKFHDPVSETADAVYSFSKTIDEENAGVEKGSVSKRMTNGVDATGSISLERKTQGLGNFIEKPIELDGFRDVKSCKELSDSGSIGSVSAEISEKDEVKESSSEIRILSYNVWFREDLEVHRRMEAIGDLIQRHSPDVICFQEITPYIYNILQKSMWWKQYRCLISYEKVASTAYFCMQLVKLPVKSFGCKPFGYTAMGRDLSFAEIETDGVKSLVIATSHLESPCPGPPRWDQFYSKERVNQAKEAINFLQKYRNAIFCGDMNWDDKLDGQFPLVEGWFDAWEKLKHGTTGWTYDTKSNKMLTGNRPLQKRLDRCICCLPDFDVIRIDMIGTEAIPDLTYNKQKKMKNKMEELTLPVLPSDHYGLLLTISSRKAEL